MRLRGKERGWIIASFHLYACVVNPYLQYEQNICTESAIALKLTRILHEAQKQTPVYIRRIHLRSATPFPVQSSIRSCVCHACIVFFYRFPTLDHHAHSLYRMQKHPR